MSKFKPLKSEKTVISVRVESDKLEQIDNIATRIDISRNELINQCLDYALQNLEFETKKARKNKD